MKFVPAMVALLLMDNSYGRVENTPHGYPSCIACHISPSGGGILTDYGRSLSAELMSTWKGPKGFERPFYGLGRNGEHFKMGGHLRQVQMRTENEKKLTDRLFVMQNNVEFAAQYMKMFLVGTLGSKEGPRNTPDKGKFLSERHFIMWDTGETSKVRAGKFRQQFGINDPNHTRLVKQSLGFGSHSETYNLDFSKFYEWGEINASAGFGDLQDGRDERNLAFNYTHYAGGNSRLGAGLLLETGDRPKKRIYGINGVFPLGKKGIGRFEVDYEEKKPYNRALYGDHMYGYRLFKGGLGYLSFEYEQHNLEDSNSIVTAYGFGFQFSPVAHFELQLEYQQKRYTKNTNNPLHQTFLLLHLYH